jgi:hypothetical protein
MIERPQFGTDELPPAGMAGDLIDALAMGRELERAADEPLPPISAAFVDGVMAAIATEPTPRPVVVASRALRAGRPLALLAAIGDAFRVAFGGGWPRVVRLPALAMVLVTVVVLGSVGTIGGYVGGQALGLWGDSPPPAPLPSPTPTPSPTPEPTPAPTLPPLPTPSPTQGVPPSPSPSATPSATDTDEPSGSPDGSDDNGGDDDDDNSGPGSGDSGSGDSGSGNSSSGSDDSENSGSGSGSSDRSGSGSSGSDDSGSDDSSGSGPG